MPESAKITKTEALLLAHVDLLLEEIRHLVIQMKVRNLIELHHLGIASAEAVNDELAGMLEEING